MLLCSTVCTLILQARMEYQSMFKYSETFALGISVFFTISCWAILPVMADTGVKAKSSVRAKAAPRTKMEVRAKTTSRPTVRATVKKTGTDKQYTLVDLKKRPLKPGWDQPYLLAAYGAVWLILFLYLLSLARRMTSTDDQLAALEQHVNEITPKDD